MNITKIRLRNVKSYADETISFKPGINIIGGANGSGKTTIIESIGYGLFGRKPDYTFEEFVMRGAKDGSIEIWFEVDDVVYRALRTFTIKQSGSWNVYYAESNRRLDLHGDEDIKKWLRESLHLESDDKIDKIFENVVGIEQGQFAQPFLLPDRKRKDYFEPVLKLDKYRNAYESTAFVSRRFGDEIKEIEHKKELNLQRVERYDERVSELSEIKTKIQELLLEVTNNSIIREGVEAELKLQEDTGKSIDETQGKLKENFAYIQSLEKEKNKNAKETAEANDAVKIIEKTKPGKEKFELLDKKIKELEVKQSGKMKLEKQKTSLEKEVINLETKIESSVQNFNSEESKLNEDILKRRKEIEELTEPIRIHEEEMKNVSERKESWETIQQFVDALSSTRNNAREVISEFEKNTGADKIKNEFTNFEEVEKTALEYETLNVRYESLGQGKARIDENVKTQTENLKHSKGGKCPFLSESCKNIELGSLEDYFKDRIHALRGDVKRIDDEIKEIRLMKTGSEKFFSDVKSGIKQNISIIQLNLVELNKKLAGFRKEKEEKDKRIAEMKSRLIEIENEKKKLTGSRKSLEDKKELIKKLTEDIESCGDVEAEILSNKKELEASRCDYNKYTANLKTAEKLTRLLEENKKILENIEERNRQRLELERKLNEYKLKFDGSKLEKLNGERKRIYELLGKLNTELAERKKDEKKIGEEIGAMNKIKEIISMQEKELEKTRNALGVFNFIRNVLNQIGPKIASHYLAHISDQAGRTYREVSGENVELIWDENYNIILKDHDKQRIFRQLSGGEQMTAAIAVRLAILKQFSKIRIGFFDEPTTHLDEERRSQLAETIGHLKELEKRWFDQLFVISHDDAFETITENVVVLKKDGGVSVKA